MAEVVITSDSEWPEYATTFEIVLVENGYFSNWFVDVARYLGVNNDDYTKICFKHEGKTSYRHDSYIEFSTYEQAAKALEEIEALAVLNKLTGG